MKILITGAAGFIGHKMVKVLAAEGAEIIGIDNINDYYSPALKEARLRDLAPLPFSFCEDGPRRP